MDDPAIERRSAFVVAGLRYHGLLDGEALGELWEAFGDRFDEFADAATSEDGFGVTVDYDDETGFVDYVAGVEVDPDASLPDGAHTVSVPEQTYAVFETTMSTADETMTDIYASWLPDAPYDRADGPGFERYGASFRPDDPNAPFDVCVPVVEREP